MSHASIDSPDRSRWSVIAAFAFLAAASQIIWLNYAPDTSFVASRFGVSESAIGWLANIIPLCCVILALPAGVVLDRWFKPSLTAAALISAGGAVLRLAGHSYGWALAGQVVLAIGQPVLLNSIPLVARNYLAEKDRAAGIAISTAGMFTGMVCVFALGAVIPSAEWLTVGIGVGTGIACAAALAMLTALRHPVRVSAFAPSGERAAVLATLRDPFIGRICLLVFFPFGTFNAIMTFAQPLLEPAGVSAGIASVMLLIMVLAGVISCVFLPVLAARRGLERPALLTGAAAAAAGCLLLVVAPSVPSGFVSLTVVGLGLLPTLPIVLEMVERHTGQSEGAASGLIWLSGNLGGVVVTAGIGLLIRLPAIAFLVCGVGVVLAAPLIRGLRVPAPAKTPTPQAVASQSA